jgi:D-alanine transfer protein
VSASHVGHPLPLTLRAAALAGALGAGLIALCLLAAGRIEQRYFRGLISFYAHAQHGGHDRSPVVEDMEFFKNQGSSLQREAFRDPAVLPMYGSSELLKAVADKAPIFFETFPTGFGVFPVGKPGSSSLILLQKIAAAGPASPGRKIAISLSPSWFYLGIDPHAYRANFSPQQALALLLSPHLSAGLKRDIARRLRDFPESMADHSLLAFLVERTAAGTPLNRFLSALTLPMSWLEHGCDSAQDRLQTATSLLKWRTHWNRPPPEHPAAPDWPALLRAAAAESHPFYIKSNIRHRIQGTDLFLRSLENNSEWADLELLLRTLEELHFQPLLLTMPYNGDFLENYEGIARSALEVYPRRMRALAARYGASVEAFEGHVEDESFLVDPHDHLSKKGWMYYNQALDRFYHAPPSRP